MQLHQALPIRLLFAHPFFLSGHDAVAQNQVSEGTVAPLTVLRLPIMTCRWSKMN